MSTPNLNPLEQLLRLNTSSPEFNDKVNDILRGEEYKQWAECVAGAEVVELVNFLDRVRPRVSFFDSLSTLLRFSML